MKVVANDGVAAAVATVIGVAAVVGVVIVVVKSIQVRWSVKNVYTCSSVVSTWQDQSTTILIQESFFML